MVVALWSAVAIAQDGGVSARQPQLRSPETLSKLARQTLRKRMIRHGDDMTRLVMAVTLLERERVKVLATSIATEPRLTRPIAGGEDDLNAGLPEKLFVLQDELRARTKALAESAAKDSDPALAAALGRVTETCVACHSAFREPL